MNKEIRAIYIGDIGFDTCPVFRLNTKTNKFEMLIDIDFQYDAVLVYEDKDFLIFELEEESLVNDEEGRKVKRI